MTLRLLPDYRSVVRKVAFHSTVFQSSVYSPVSRISHISALDLPDCVTFGAEVRFFVTSTANEVGLEDYIKWIQANFGQQIMTFRGAIYLAPHPDDGFDIQRALIDRFSLNPPIKTSLLLEDLILALTRHGVHVHLYGEANTTTVILDGLALKGVSLMVLPYAKHN